MHGSNPKKSMKMEEIHTQQTKNKKNYWLSEKILIKSQIKNTFRLNLIAKLHTYLNYILNEINRVIYTQPCIKITQISSPKYNNYTISKKYSKYLYSKK